MRAERRRLFAANLSVAVLALSALWGCSPSETDGEGGTGGVPAATGGAGMGGTGGTAGVITGIGGAGTGGATGTGGSAAGGASGTGGAPGTGGTSGAGGAVGTGGRGSGGARRDRGRRDRHLPSPVLKAGDTNKTIQVGSQSRTYVLHVPAKYDGSKPMPLVVDFHPLGGSGPSERSGSPYPAQTDPEGVVMAFPTGLSGPSGGAWNVGPCCVANIDDVAFARALVAMWRRSPASTPSASTPSDSRWAAACPTTSPATPPTCSRRSRPRRSICCRRTSATASRRGRSR